MAELLTCEGPPTFGIDPRSLTCALPVQSASEAHDFLESIGAGSALGTGTRMTRLGAEMPHIRAEYERRIAELVAEVERRKTLGQSAREIAEWVVNERRAIANVMRWRSGAGTRVLFEIRDWTAYGMGGRTYANVSTRYASRGLSGPALEQQMIRGATHANTGISEAALKGARYLKNGGRIVVIISIATTAYVLLTADPKDLERLIYEEAGAFIGGSAGTGLAVGVCLVFGIATGGWGLLACGAIGGIAGGLAGSQLGNRIFYSKMPKVETLLVNVGKLDFGSLAPDPPVNMCVSK
jgi:hypothetical protein